MSLSGSAPTVGIALDEAEHIAALTAPYLPPSLATVFDARFSRSNALYDEFVYRLTLQVFFKAGLDTVLADWGSAE
jgi:hypothetical protein